MSTFTVPKHHLNIWYIQTTTRFKTLSPTDQISIKPLLTNLTKFPQNKNEEDLLQILGTVWFKIDVNLIRIIQDTDYPI